MSSDQSVTECLKQVVNGAEGEPQEQLVERYLQRLTALAKKRLGDLRTYEDEDDVALSALRTFFRRAKEGRFDRLTDRDSLWKLLATITVNKAINLHRRQNAEKRGRERQVPLDSPESLVDSVIEQGNQLLESLPKGSLRDVARMRMEGYTDKEIAARIQQSVKTVERKMKLIRQKLAKEMVSG